MLKGYKFNQYVKKINSKSVYEQEHELLHDFLASENENIYFEYGSTQEAINARAALVVYIKRVRQPLQILQRGNCVFAIRIEEEKTECTN